ncbi:MFS transporter [Staphylococcus canis]|uniref:Quinolone resistance protein NorB n=1 Tax=Staphylococcus canis TaxID=2724942 RepID=A0ABS0TB41_9STAP|nr:MFS transporter [Staphylococcus canis]MBI5975971.1 MFS transporter [Staphylococcus canis]
MEERHFEGNAKLLIGIVFGVITFWMFALSLVNVVPTLHNELHTSFGLINVAVSVTALFSGMFVVGAGGLADKYGHVKMAYLGLTLSIIGSLIVILSPHVIVFIIGRSIQGISAAFIMPSTLSIIKAYYKGRKRQAALSYWSIGSWGGGGIASFFGGMMDTFLGWRWIFILSIVIAVLAMILMKGTPEVPRRESSVFKHFDSIGLVLFLAAILSLNIIITQSSEFGLFSPLILSLIAVFFASIIGFIILERYRTSPLIDFEIFKDKGYTGATISNFLMNGVAGTLIVGNTFVQQSMGFSSAQAGLLTVTYLMTVLCTIRVGEKILQRLGAGKPMMIGSGLNMVGILLISCVFLPPVWYVVICVIGYFIYGIGLGFYATPSMDTAIANTPDDKVGMASGVYKMSSSLGNAFGVAMSTTLYFIGKTAFNIEMGAMFGLWLNVLMALIAFVIVLNTIPKNQGAISSSS